MPITKKTLFKFENIDQINGQCIVRLINPYGPIQSGEKTLEDFQIEIEVDTTSFDLEGNRIREKRTVMSTDNPNEDLVYAYDIPLDENGNFISAEELANHIARQYPHDQFEAAYSRKQAVQRTDLTALLDVEHEIDVVYPDPIEISDTGETVEINPPSSTVIL
jgi:hypothetical protein